MIRVNTLPLYCTYYSTIDHILIRHHTLIAVAPTFIRRHYAIFLMDTYSLNACTTIRVCRASGKEVDRVDHTVQTDYSTPAASLGRCAHSRCEALSLAGFLTDKVWLERRRVVIIVLGEWWSPSTARRNQNDSCPFELGLCQTFRGHSEGASGHKRGTLQ